ncbi:MAG: precorrin-4 C(11)-methyltransferase [Coprococcus sp.]
MIHFVGAGPGAPDLITVRGQKLLQEADVIIYAGSLVNPSLLDVKKESCHIYNSAHMTLEEVLQVMRDAEKAGLMTVRLHTGDPCLYGAIREQMDALREDGIDYDICPGVSAFCGAAASLELEYTLPGVSQTVIISRTAGRTPVPEKESINKLASHQATMVLFLSAGHLPKLQEELMAGGYPADTPAAICYKATWPEEKKLYCTIETLAETAVKENITSTALIIVGQIIDSQYNRSLLYDPTFTTAFRQGSRQL